MKHTPGPWRIDDAGPNSGNVIRFEIVAGSRKVCEIEDSSIDIEAMDKVARRHAARLDEADARLIAAAPELLAAAKAATRELHALADQQAMPDDSWMMCLTQIEAAIAKAEGKLANA